MYCIYLKQEGQCTYNVTMRRVRANIVALEKQLVLHKLSVCTRICSVRYPACHAHAPYCNLWPAPLCNIFPHYLLNGKIFEKQVIEHKRCFEFLDIFFLKYFLF